MYLRRIVETGKTDDLLAAPIQFLMSQIALFFGAQIEI